MPVASSQYDAVIVGGGPAGLTAGMHLARAGYKTLLLERGSPGGQASRIGLIENYPGFPDGIEGRELMRLWVRQACRWNLRILKKEASGISRQDGNFGIRVTDGSRIFSRALLLCAGMEFKKLGIGGEERLWGRGIYHDAWDESLRLKGKTAAVAGGGEAAVHQALHLSRYAKKVYLICRGDRLRAHRLLRNRVSGSRNILLLFQTVVEKAEGRKRLEGIWVRNLASGIREHLKTDGLFVLIGKQMSHVPFAGFRKKPGFFIAGDAAGWRFRQVAVAGGDGMKAAMECIRYLERDETP